MDRRAFQCDAGVAAVRRDADAGSERLTDLLFGETFWGVAEGDDVVGATATDRVAGRVLASALRPKASEPTHRICRPLVRVFGEPHLAATTQTILPMNALVELSGRTAMVSYPSGGSGSEVVEMCGGGWVTSQGVRAIGAYDDDAMTTARSFLGVPYLHGGKTALGCDASGFVQTVLAAHGVSVPRTLDEQRTFLADVEIDMARVDSVVDRCLLIVDGEHCSLMSERRIVCASTRTLTVTEFSAQEFLENHKQRDRCRLFDLTSLEAASRQINLRSGPCEGSKRV